jgi:hypothetical protein
MADEVKNKVRDPAGVSHLLQIFHLAKKYGFPGLEAGSLRDLQRADRTAAFTLHQAEAAADLQRRADLAEALSKAEETA